MMSLFPTLLLAAAVPVTPANGTDKGTGPEGVYHLFKGNSPALYELSGPGTVKVDVRRAQTGQGPEKIRILGLIDGEEVWATVMGNTPDEASGLAGAGSLQQGEFTIGEGPKTLVLRVPDAEAGGFHIVLKLEAAQAKTPKPMDLEQPALAPVPDVQKPPPAPAAPAAPATPPAPVTPPPAPAATPAPAPTPESTPAAPRMPIRLHAALINSLVFGGLASTGSELRFGADTKLAGGLVGVRIGITGANAEGMLMPSVSGLSPNGSDTASVKATVSSTQIPITIRYGLTLPGSNLQVNGQGGLVVGSLSGTVADGATQGGGAFGFAGSVGASITLPQGLELGLELAGKRLANDLGSSGTAALGIGIGYAYDL